MLEHISFESNRLLTQDLIESDALTLFQMYSDAEAMKFRGSQPLKTIEDAYRVIAEQATEVGQLKKRRTAIRLKTNNQLIGTLLLSWRIDGVKHCEIGFSFGKEHWNKGYGKETLEMVEGKLKKDSEICQINAWCVKGNFASIKIFQGAGFSEVEQSEHPQSRLFVKALKPA